MSIWNKVLVGLILVASLAFLALAARALKTHQYWGQVAEKIEAELETAQNESASLKDEVRDAEVAVHNLLVDRGRVWRNCSVGQVQVGGNQGVSLSVNTDLPDPNGVAVKTILYIFEQKDGGAYLGQFTVTGVGNKQLQLVPTMRLDDRERQRLQQSQGPWALYDVMPVDQHEVLAGLSDEEIRAMFPAATADQYLADRQAIQAEASDPNAAKPRQLRDYGVLFAEMHKQRSMANDSIAAVQNDLKYLESAQADAKQQEQFRRDEIASLQKEKDTELKQLAEVAKHLKDVETKLAEVQASIVSLMKDNQAKAGEIARIQLEATREIDKQSERVAQAANL